MPQPEQTGLDQPGDLTALSATKPAAETARTLPPQEKLEHRLEKRLDAMMRRAWVRGALISAKV